jgi:hypothetical protein
VVNKCIYIFEELKSLSKVEEGEKSKGKVFDSAKR